MATSTLRPGILPGTYVLSPTRKLATRMTESILSETDIKSAMSMPLSPRSRMATASASTKPQESKKMAVGEEGFYERAVTFSGYFKESVPESPIETWRIRYVVLHFSLGEETLDIEEPEAPHMRNDGIVHGRFLSHAHVEGLTRDSFMLLMRVGSVFECFGRAIKLYACDTTTRAFFEELGFAQPLDVEPELDPYTENALKTLKPEGTWHGTKTSSITRYLEAARGCQRDFKRDLKARYLQYDGLYLRFLLLWETRDGVKTEAIRYWLTYYLATQDVDVKEEKGQRFYYSAPTLLARMRLPKTTLPHDDRMRSCEDVTGDEDYYHEGDFVVGSYINVYGRKMLVCECEEKTNDWYKAEFGFDQNENRVSAAKKEVATIVHAVPPHNGFGSEEDTLNSLKSLVLKQPKKDFSKFTGDAFRFKAHLVTADPIDKGRDFRITYYTDEKETSMYEPPVRNSGVVGGSFLKRGKYKNPSTDVYYLLEDFVVGQEVTINCHRFHIYGTEVLSHKA